MLLISTVLFAALSGVWMGSSCSASVRSCRLLLMRVRTRWEGFRHRPPAAASGCSLQAAVVLLNFESHPAETRSRQKHSARQFQRDPLDHVQLRRRLRSHRHTPVIVVVQLSVRFRSKERLKCSFLNAETAYAAQKGTAWVAAVIFVGYPLSHPLLAFCAVQETQFRFHLPGRHAFFF